MTTTAENRLAEQRDPSARLDALEAELADATARIDEVLTPEPMDWDRHYADTLASVAATAARIEKGGGA